jgi:hypothetical protein
MIPDGDKKGTTRITKDRRNVRSMTKPGLVAPEEYSSMVGSSIKLLSFRVLEFSLKLLRLKKVQRSQY